MKNKSNTSMGRQTKLSQPPPATSLSLSLPPPLAPRARFFCLAEELTKLINSRDTAIGRRASCFVNRHDFGICSVDESRSGGGG